MPQGSHFKQSQQMYSKLYLQKCLKKEQNDNKEP